MNKSGKPKDVADLICLTPEEAPLYYYLKRKNSGKKVIRNVEIKWFEDELRPWPKEYKDPNEECKKRVCPSFIYCKYPGCPYYRPAMTEVWAVKCDVDEEMVYLAEVD